MFMPAFWISPYRYFHYGLILSALVLAGNLAGILWITDEQIKLVYFDLVSPLVNAIATIMFVAARQSFRKSRRLGLAWAILGCAQLFYTLGDVAWAVLEVGLAQTPFPSIADALYLAYYPLFLIGVFLLPGERNTRRTC